MIKPVSNRLSRGRLFVCVPAAAPWLAALACAAACSAACGKKGPPLPPLVRIPVAPADFTAERRGDEVSIQFTVPAANTDHTRPANIERVDVYAMTAPPSVPDEVLLKRGTVVGSVAVKAPRDPNQAVDADEPDEEAEPLEGEGLQQGVVAHVADRLTPAALAPAGVDVASKKSGPRDSDEGPLVGPPLTLASRIYAGVGVTTRGRKGAVSRRAVVPLVPPPPSPPVPAIKYDEQTIHLAWDAAAVGDADVLPAHPLGMPPPAFAYHVYELAPNAGGDGAPPVAVRLTKAPVDGRQYDDARMDWGKKRCYAVSTVEVLGNMSIESEPSAPACVTLADTFPPAAPHGLRAVGTEGAISLIWDPNSEADLAGYLVLRGPSPESLAPITPAPIADTTFRDTVPSGIRFFYAVAAVDKAGNRSAPSAAVEESARN